MPAPTLTPARQALAATIGARAAAAERLERVRAGRWKSFGLVTRAEDKVAEAEAALAAARDSESARIVAELVGDDARGGPTVAEAEAALAKAKREHATAERARDMLQDTAAAERDLHLAESRLHEAVGAVVASEGLTEALLTEYEVALDRVADLRAIIDILPGRSSQQMSRSSTTIRNGTGAGLAAWRAALAALEGDPSASLPTASALDIETQPAARAAA